jgi:hypothetical protein
MSDVCAAREDDDVRLEEEKENRRLKNAHP